MFWMNWYFAWWTMCHRSLLLWFFDIFRSSSCFNAQNGIGRCCLLPCWFLCACVCNNFLSWAVLLLTDGFVLAEPTLLHICNILFMCGLTVVTCFRMNFFQPHSKLVVCLRYAPDKRLHQSDFFAFMFEFVVSDVQDIERAQIHSRFVNYRLSVNRRAPRKPRHSFCSNSSVFEKPSPDLKSSRCWRGRPVLWRKTWATVIMRWAIMRTQSDALQRP